MKKKLIGLVGLGAAVAPHAKSLLELRDRVDVRAFSPTATRRDSFANMYGFPVTGRLEVIVDDPEVDAVFLLTPPNTRLNLVRRIAAAGKPILMEKPLERTYEAAQEVVAITEGAGISTGVVFQHRFRPGAERLRSLVESGGLGVLAAAYLDVPWWRPQSYYDEPGRGTFDRDGGGVLITQAIHSLDLFLSLTGPVKSVQAITGTSVLHRMEGEDFAAGGIVFKNGALGVFSATTAMQPGYTEKILLVGTIATAILTGGHLTVDYHNGNIEHFGDSEGLGSGANHMAFSHEPHKSVITNFLDALDTYCAPRCTASDALGVHELIDAILRSSHTGHRIEL